MALQRLGKRLSEATTPEDLALLASFRQAHTPALTGALHALVSLFPSSEVALSARIKNSATIIDKLSREQTMNLGTMQDIAGVRLVLLHGGRARQKEVATELLKAPVFSGPKLIDRLADPKSGYRALHIHGTYEGRRIELQMRTQLQHDWAQFFERLADVFGRQIRYGGAPSPGNGPVIRGVAHTREDVIQTALELSNGIDDAERVGSVEREADAQAELHAFRDVLVPLARSGAVSPPPWGAGAGLCLVLYNRRSSQTLSWETGKAEELQPKWSALEQQYGGDDNMEIVLLASSSVETLSKTHARYFTSMPGV